MPLGHAFMPQLLSVRSVDVLAKRLRQSLLPTPRITLQMHDRDHQETILTYLVEDAVWESVRDASPTPPGEPRPSLWKGSNALERGLDLGRELIAKPWALVVIVVHSFGEIALSTGQYADTHLWLILAKTASAESESSSPAS